MYNNVDREIKGYVEVIYDIKELQEGDYFTAYYYNQSGRTNALLPFEYGKTLNDVLTTPREINNYREPQLKGQSVPGLLFLEGRKGRQRAQ